MWMMLQQKKPDDYVISSGKSYSVRAFCGIAFAHVGLKYQDYVVTNKKFFRPAEVDILLGNSDKAHRTLNWKPTFSFKDLVYEMLENDLMYFSKRNKIHED